MEGTAPSAPVTRVALTITTHPSGAALTITSAGDGPRTATSPATLLVAAGPVTVALSAPDRQPRTESIDVRATTNVDVWLDLAGTLHHKLREMQTGANPKQVAFTPDGRELWVPLLGGHGVDVFDVGTGQRLSQVRLGEHGAVEVIFNHTGTRAYVSQMETATVYELDRVERRVLRTFRTGGRWTKVMALSPDEKTLYAANWVSDDVSEIDLTLGTVRRRIPTVRTPRGLAVSPDGTRLYVAGFENGELARVTLATGTQQVLLRTGGALRHLVLDGANNRLYADDMGHDATFVHELSSDTVRPLAPTESHPNTIALTGSGRVLYVSNRGHNAAAGYNQFGPDWGSVLAIDTTNGAMLDAIVGGNQTTGLDVSPDGRLLAFTNFLDNRVELYAIPPLAALLAGGGGRGSRHTTDLVKTSASAAPPSARAATPQVGPPAPARPRISAKAAVKPVVKAKPRRRRARTIV